MPNLVELVLTPQGRERVGRGWAKLPKWLRVVLGFSAAITTWCLIVAVGIALVVELAGSGYVLGAVLAGCLTTGVGLGSVFGSAVYFGDKL